MEAVNETVKLANRIAIAVVGTTVLLLGVVMIITPGSAFILIPVGLAILGLEFAWARLWLRWSRRRISRKNSENHGERAEEYRRIGGRKERSRRIPIN